MCIRDSDGIVGLALGAAPPAASPFAQDRRVEASEVLDTLAG